MSVKCNLCGIEGLNQQHSGMAECVSFLGSWVDRLYDQIPPGECFLRCPIGKWNGDKQTTVRVWIDGEVTQDAWKHFQQILALMDTSFSEVSIDMRAAKEGMQVIASDDNTSENA